MQPNQFMDAIQSVVSKDKRYDIEAYFTLKEALDFTVKKRLKRTVANIGTYQLKN